MAKRTVETKFYTFNQNNSGGYFVKSDEFGVCEYVIIEAINAESAFNRLKEIGENVSGFMDYCGCCGERWSDWIDDDEGTKEPMIYDEPVKTTKKGDYRESCFVHYFNKTFKKYNFNQ